MNLISTAMGLLVMDDTYNANPGSMKEAILTWPAIRARAAGWRWRGHAGAGGIV